MKKVEKVSIAEISFTLDSDAYISLKQYLDSLRDYYENDPDGGEIIADIEARIAELILDEQVYTKVVSRSLVDTIIAQLGTPDQIDDEIGESAEGFGSGHGRGSGSGFSGAAGMASGGHSGGDGSIPRRLHRSSEGKIFGGVCSGLATFLEISVAWIRLVFLIPAFLFFVSLPVNWHWLKDFSEGWGWVFFVTYIVLWIALPLAKTPRQKLEARGQKITQASIRQTMQEAASTPAGKKAASVAAELVNVLGRVVLFFVKFVMAVIGFSILFTAAAIFMGMLAVLFHPTTVVVANGVSIISLFDGMRTPVFFVLLTLFCAFMPLVVTGMAMLSFTFSWRLGRMFYGLTLGSWALAIILCGFVAISEARFFHDVLPDRIERLEHHGDWRHDQDREEWRNAPERVTIREIRDSLDDADSLEIDPVAPEAMDEVGDSTRVEIRRIE